ncbi:MAG: protein-glutamate O-methyltransferase CheR [Sulfitobacter sp.]|nr:protein-glutamate O-methyltransferase CheR [Sulfitobacter sp.]
MGAVSRALASELPKDLLLDAESFRAIADLAYSESGLTLVPEKLSMVQSRLRHRLRKLGLGDFAQYCALVKSEAGHAERRHLISALTTNVSHFFREKHHYDRLIEIFCAKLPELRAGQSMRIWSAGCSNGQEAVSVAIALLEVARDAGNLDLRILGTDIDPQVVQFAREGRYPERLLGGVSEAQRAQFFHRTRSGSEETLEISPTVRSLLRFNELNLLASWPMSRRFDVILCRNVVIYFDQATQLALWPRFHTALNPDGVLILGHSERIADPAKYGFEAAGPTTYRLATQG